MAAKLLQSLSDDNTDLQGQIGCMTGIFQLFDRQQIINSRPLGGITPKRLPSGSSCIYGGHFDGESNNIYHRPTSKEKKSPKNFSVESSRPSFSSSSRSSSFSSLDCNIKTKQPDSLSKLKDSPRQTFPSDLDMNESLRVLAKLQQSPWYCDEDRDDSRTFYGSKSGEPTYYVSSNPPRFSYDGRETIRLAPKHKELPRLSLDSREGSTRSFNSDNKPSVVAKLMGLETLPDADVAVDNFTRSSRPIVVPVSSPTRKDPAAAPRRTGDVAMRPLSSSRFPIEPAPWKHPSVYSEIEKRLKDLEFTQSGKDLRALKQILGAMQAKGILDNSTRREGLDGNFAKPQMNARSVNKAKAFESPIVIMKPAKMNPKSDEYLHNRKALVNNRYSKEQVSKASVRIKADPNPRSSKLGQSSIRLQNSAKENATSSTSVSPRLQQRKLELEKRSRSPISPDLSKTRRQAVKNQHESNSAGGKHRGKIVKKQQNDDQSSEVSSENKDLSYEEDDSEVTSSERLCETNGSQSPFLKATKYAVSGLIQQRFVSNLNEGECGEFGSVAPDQPSPVSVLDDTMYADDVLSPVKQKPVVLKDDTTVTDNTNREEKTRPKELVPSTTIDRKKLENIDNLVKKLRRLNSTHDETHTDYIASLCENTNPDHRYISEILLASGLLLRDLNSSLSIFQLHPSGYPINPELFFVLEKTKASTLEKEYGKNVRVKCDKEKFHRKLIFDAVNEILVKKLSLMGTINNKLARRSLSAQKLLRDLCSEIENLQMKKTSFVIEDEEDNLKGILCEDVMSRSENWTEFSSDLSAVVLDIERLIFKDLISDIVYGESLKIKTVQRGRQVCRRLFA